MMSPPPEPPPEPPPLAPPVPPWTPFETLPVDSEPDVAKIRQRRLGRLMATARFKAQPREWQAVAIEAYLEARQALAAAAQAQMQAQGVSGTQPKPPANPPPAQPG
jgi:hypothetical protein